MTKAAFGTAGILIGLGVLAAGAVQQKGAEAMTGKVMESTLAGRWYDADPDRLRTELKGYLDAAEVQADPAVVAVIAPHAGYAYSGPCAATAIQLVARRPDLRRVVVLGFSHRVAMPNQISVPSQDTRYRSPLGETPLDTEAIAGLLAHPLFRDVPASRPGENSVEMMLPLLQAALEGRDWSLVPVTLGQLDDAARDQAARVLAGLLDGHTVFVVSSDFTHYGPQFGYVPFREDVAENLRRLDGGAIDRILAGDADGFEAYCRETGATICGRDSIGVLLRMLPQDVRAWKLAYDTSGRVTGDFDTSVSYAALAFSAPNGVKRTECDDAVGEAAPAAADVLPEADRKVLLELARKSIEHALDGSPPKSPGDLGVEPTPAMEQVMGGFVTLTIDGELRGCIGEILPRRPLAEVVVERAQDAALHDPRFPPLRAGDLPRVRIEISALTPPEPVDSYEDIEIGRHGMVLQRGGRSAVFLPQVAPEQGWDLATTLTHLSMKAGLPPDAWKDPRTTYTVFEAIVFHE